MVLKKVNPVSKNRTELLGFLQRLKISTSTKLRIARIMENKTDEQAEELAIQIFNEIKACKNEAEILAKLFRA